ncbi:unnamed protein product [Symbiodinium pilosum]|uniref:Uncharacterized protein n=1 Tax=Symbiodinium pilosum TaxID=2952 RepID=A0A812WJF0_SYMPI|nr:unnamed protein product [Symbiodinium pilosum]
MSMMQDETLQPDVITYSAAVSACEKKGQWQAALLLLFELEGASGRADMILASSAISSCEKRSQWTMAVFLLMSMLSSGLKADGIMYNSAISACEKERWEMALWLYEDAKIQQLETNVP